jgi:hypothetical protein
MEIVRTNFERLPAGIRTYRRILGDSLTLEWSERDSAGEGRGRG